MITRLIEWCFARRYLIFVISVLAALAGAIAWQNIPVEAYPDVSPVNVKIVTQVPGLAAEEIEQQVTVPLERALAAVPGVVDSRSSSTFGLSLITLIFRDGIDLFTARQISAEELSNVSLLNGVSPELDSMSGPAGEIYRYTLESNSQNLLQLSDIQRWIVIPALQRVQGVVQVDNFGGLTREYQVVLDVHALMHNHVSIDDVIDALKSANANAGGGRITRGEQSYIVRGVGMIHHLDEMKNIVVARRGNHPIYLSDVGKVQFGHKIRQGILGKNANPDTIEGTVTMIRGANPSIVLKDLHLAVQQLQAKLARMDVRLVPFNDRDTLVQATISKVSETMIEGIILVVVILTLFLGCIRSALVTAVAIPLALATVFLLMHLNGMAANLFSLGAIDFGIVVDGAIVVTEAILRLRERAPDRVLEYDDVLEVARVAGRSIFVSTLIIIVAYSPLFAFVGGEGKLFRPMAYTVAFALIGALLCALCLTPSLSYLALRNPKRIWHVTFIARLNELYIVALKRLIMRPWPVYVGSALALVFVVLLGGSIGRAFLPDLDEGALWIQVQLPTGISLDEASKMAGKLRRIVRSLPETSYAITQLGRNDEGTDPWTFSHIEMPVGLRPYNQWPSGETKADFVAHLRDELRVIPAISFGISQPIQDNLDDLVGGAHSALVLRIYGDDLHKLRDLGGQVVSALKSTPGTVGASIFQEPEIPQLVITPDRGKAARFGVSMDDIASLLQNAVGGSAVTQIYTGNRVYDATLRLPLSELEDIDRFRNLPLKTASGAMIPLSDVAQVHFQMGESDIAHEMAEREITIRVDNGTRPLSQYLADARARIAKKVTIDPQHFRLQWAGSFEQEQRAEARLNVALLAMLAVMLALLFFVFGTFRHALLVLGVVPLALLGGLVAVAWRAETLNIATAIGFIALFGVAVQNGIIMVTAINRHFRNGMNVREAVIRGANERFRPVLMTATVASIGMLPAAHATGIGTDVQRGLATVVVGGLGIATLLTLFVLPVYFCVMEEWLERRRAARGRAHV